jgi:imidazolonepropionase-like amidohydrolase
MSAMNGVTVAACAIPALAICAIPAAATAQTIAITGGTVHTVAGPAIEGGTVVIEDGLIVAVGPDIQVPAGAERIDATGKVVTPGLIDLGTSIGLVEVDLERQTRDDAMGGDFVVAAFDVTDGINPRSTLIAVTRLGGITTVASRPVTGLIPGQAAVIDLAGATLDEMLVRPRAAMMANYGSGAASLTGGSRGSASLRLREVLDDATFWQQNQDAFQRGELRPLSHSRLDLEALQPILDGEVPLVVNVDRASDILAVMRIAEEYGIRLVIERGAEAWLVRDQLAAAGVPVILRPLSNLPGSFASLGSRFDNAALLGEAGVAIALSTFDNHNARDLTLEAGNAARFGLPWSEALRAVTLTPAEIYGIADRYGSLEPGKVANIVVWSGDPFELSSRADVVLIRGRRMPLTSRQTELFERYVDLDSGWPPAYTGGREAADSP